VWFQGKASAREQDRPRPALGHLGRDGMGCNQRTTDVDSEITVERVTRLLVKRRLAHRTG
jgi:hypothetical protein